MKRVNPMIFVMGKGKVGKIEEKRTFFMKKSELFYKKSQKKNF